MNNFDPKTQIAIIWSIEDVQENHLLLTNDQAFEVLKALEQYHDANVGINWEVIDVWVKQLFPELTK